MEDLINQIGLLVIPVLVPLAVAAFKKLWGNVPPVVLPLLAAILGPVFDLAIGAVAGVESSGVWAVLLGLAGVGLRELKDQITKAVTAAP